MENRCRALLKQIICFSPENGSISLMLDAWVKSMNPQRANWLSVLNELERLNHPLYFEEKDVEISLNLMICKGQGKGHEQILKKSKTHSEDFTKMSQEFYSQLKLSADSDKEGEEEEDEESESDHKYLPRRPTDRKFFALLRSSIHRILGGLDIFAIPYKSME
ncbi:pentatricopeptide repeat-containing protein [Forsythia ovata]|uniref:Pentatricopeptide repeat-containing protein n=1 Tax=Forsythia ovata TaxID=205694 RepID=A0ABD1SR19_9LAMI